MGSENEDIKKALDICGGITGTCNDCPYHNTENCSDALCSDALALIIKQESEIARLKAEKGE